jgi:ribosome maturation protein SDO1
MGNVIARIKVKGKNFEILVDVDKAIQLKKGMSINMQNVIAIDRIFSDSKKGIQVPEKELEDAFGTSDVYVIADKIVRQGEVQMPLDYKRKEQEDKVKQVIDFLSKYAVNPANNLPHPASRIEQALKQAGVNIENRNIEEQIGKIVENLNKVMPIKIQTKKILIKIPAEHTGKVYGLLNNYKEKEDWMSDGSLQCIVNIPVGLQGEFYDKLNGITHGSALTREVKEQGN